MLKKLLVNIGAGYIQKVIQVFCGLITVPILLSEQGLGLAGYGQLVVCQSLVATLSMSFDGFRLVASKTIGSDTDNIYSNTNTILFYTFLIAIPPICLFIVLSEEIFSFSKVRNYTPDLMILLCSFFLLEQLLYVSEQSFHSQLKTFIINLVNSLESIIRMIWIFIVFRDNNGTISSYFTIFITLYFFKLLIYRILSITRPTSEKKTQSFFFKFLFESLPLSLKGSVIFIVFRLSIILANKYLSSELAAVFSFIFVTLRGYLGQVFVSVLRPMAIPILARKQIRNLHATEKENFLLSFGLYESLVIIAILTISSTCFLWLPLWLGNSFVNYTSIVSFAIGFLGIECAFSLRNMTLISQGLGNYLTTISILCCTAYVAVLYFVIQHDAINLNTFVLMVCCYLFVYEGLSVNFLFHRKLIKSNKPLFLLIILITPLISQFYISTNKILIAASIYINIGLLLVFTGITLLIFWPELKKATKIIKKGNP